MMLHHLKQPVMVFTGNWKVPTSMAEGCTAPSATSEIHHDPIGSGKIPTAMDKGSPGSNQRSACDTRTTVDEHYL